MKRILFLFVGLLFLFSCEYQDNGVTSINDVITSDYLLAGNLDTYIQNNQIVRLKGKPGITTVSVWNADLTKYQPCFVLYVANGTTPSTTVSSAIIKLDDLEVLNTSDFSKNSGQYQFEVCNLTQTSVLTIEVRGEPDSFINFWIEGKLKELTDRDGNVYKTVNMGTQVWMAENLKTTKYKDGTSIPLVEIELAWDNLTTPGYCWYGNNEANKNIYGALYNWHTVNTGNLCPNGWHVPTDAEWTTFENYLIANGYNYDGSTSTDKIAKSLAATSEWNSSGSPGAIGNIDYPDKRNATGFTAYPGGYVSEYPNATFGNMHDFGAWWTATEFYPTTAWLRLLNFDVSYVFRYNFDKREGYSVRCIKD